MSYSKEECNVADRVHHLDKQIRHELKYFEARYLGRCVRLVKGWRKGERGSSAIIDGVMFHEGQILFLCMVINKKGERVNRDAYTRQWRPRSDFELLAEEWW